MSRTLDKSGLESFVNELILFTELSVQEDFIHEPGRAEFGTQKTKSREDRFPLSYIGPVELFIPELSSDVDRGFFLDVTPSDLGGKWDVSTVKLPNPEDAGEIKFQLQRVRSVPLRELRYTGKMYGTHATEINVAYVNKNGTYTTAKTVAFYIGRDSNGFGRWVTNAWHSKALSYDDAYGSRVLLTRRPEEDPELTGAINATLGIAFTRDYDWTVTVSLANMGNPLVLPTDPFGVKEIFFDREKNGDRRAALRHWVSEHWRKKRSDPQIETFVREHLRGFEPFIWRGFECQLAVSPYDLRRAQRLEQERKEMKREGKTMRMRAYSPGMA